MGKRRGRGEGGVEQLPDGRWRAVLSLGVDPVTRKRRRMKFYGKTKQEALAKLREAQTAHGKGELDRAGRTTFGEWAARWLAVHKEAVEHSTWRRYREVIEGRLVPWLGPVRLAKITEETVEGLYADLAGAGLSASERNRCGQYLSTVMRAALRRKLIRSNPVPEVPRPKKPRAEFPSWTVAQVGAFLTACRGHRLEPLFTLALDTGARPGELYALHWPQVDLRAGTVALLRSLDSRASPPVLKDVKTPRGRRTVAVARQTVELLRAHRERMRAEGRDVEAGPVFLSEAGSLYQHTSVYHNHFLPLVRRAGVPRIRPYDLRHTSATLLLVAGVNIKVVSERLGHASIQITLDHYAKVLPGMQALAAAAMESILPRPDETAPQQPPGAADAAKES